MYNFFLRLRTYLIIKRKEILNGILPKSDKHTSFVILCEPRTGSTLLHTYLNFHPHIKSYGEVLREQIENKTSPDHLSTYIFEKHGKHLDSIGMKLFYFYYDHPAYSEQFKEVVSQPACKVIHIIRKDIFKLYVSLKMAQKTNRWSTGKPSNPNQKIFIQPDEFKAFATTYLQRQQYFTKLFKNHPVLFITYEDLYQNPQPLLEKIQLFLGVKPRKLISLLKKQTPDDLRLVVVNYDEVMPSIYQILKEMGIQNEERD